MTMACDFSHQAQRARAESIKRSLLLKYIKEYERTLYLRPKSNRDHQFIAASKLKRRARTEVKGKEKEDRQKRRTRKWLHWEMKVSEKNIDFEILNRAYLCEH